MQTLDLEHRLLHEVRLASDWVILFSRFVFPYTSVSVENFPQFLGHAEPTGMNHATSSFDANLH